MIRKLVLPFALVLAGALAQPAAAQKRDDKSKVLQNEEPTNPSSADDAGEIMKRALPFKEVQTLRYFSPSGEYQGYAVRRHHTIRFYDPAGTFIGKAQRVTQRATNYYAPDGTYLGRRTQQKMTVANTATFNPGAKGFLEDPGDLTKPK
jgi:hypothetical protein